MYGDLTFWILFADNIKRNSFLLAPFHNYCTHFLSYNTMENCLACLLVMQHLPCIQCAHTNGYYL